MERSGERSRNDDELARLRAKVAELERRLAAYSDTGAAPLRGSALSVSVSEREELLREAEGLAQMGSWFWNVETSEVHWSDGLFQILGQNPATDRASIEAFFDAVHPVDAERVRAASARTSKQGDVEEAEVRMVRRDGAVRHVRMTSAHLYDDAGRLRRIVGACLDVTEAREAERRLERANTELEEAQAVAGVGSWVLDAESGEVRWSTQLRRILETGPDVEPAMFELFERFHPEDQTRVRDLHERVLGGAAQGETEVRLRVARGQPAFVKVREVAQRGPDGRLIAVRGTVKDVTEERSIVAQIAHGQKMEAIGRLAGGVAHDLNNHLMVIQGNLHLLGLPSSDELEALCGAVEAARQTASRLLAFGRKSPLRRKHVDVNELVGQTALLLGTAVGADVTLDIRLGDELEPIDADAALFGQSLVNLVLNARDASAAGGRVTIETARGAEPGFVEVRVRDEGTGMSEATRARAFEPFFTTKAVGKGSGLGLAMVQGALVQHGGGVAIESEVGKGTLVTLRWPVARRAAGSATTSAIRPTSARGARATVLLVEDQPAVARMIERLLEADQHRVLVADRPSRAIELAAKHGATIDLLVSDVVMPEMRGPALVEALEDRLGLRPAVVYVTGFPAEELDLGPTVTLLRKPFTIEELRVAIASVLHRPAGSSLLGA